MKPVRYYLISVICTLMWLASGPSHDLRADESDAFRWVQNICQKPRAKKDRQSGTILELAINAPELRNKDFARFLEFPKLKKLTISHVGLIKSTGETCDYSGITALKDHPNLDYFSAGGALGTAYLAALSELENISKLYIQTTKSVDSDFAPIGEMHHLTYLGIRVRNDRFSKLTDQFFKNLHGLKNLDEFFLSEMTFKDPEPFIAFLTSLPKLRKLTLSRSPLPDNVIEAIKEANPKVEVTIQGRVERK